MSPDLFDYDQRLGRLSDAETAVYKQVELKNYDVDQVAGIRNCEPTTVRTLLHRARRKLGEHRRVPS